MIWLKTIQRQIERVDSEGKYDWGIDFDEEKGTMVVCLHRVYPENKDHQQILLRIEDQYSDYAGFRIKMTLKEMKEKMDRLVKSLEEN